jgi:hypothetical protein
MVRAINRPGPTDPTLSPIVEKILETISLFSLEELIDSYSELHDCEASHALTIRDRIIKEVLIWLPAASYEKLESLGLDSRTKIGRMVEKEKKRRRKLPIDRMPRSLRWALATVLEDQPYNAADILKPWAKDVDGQDNLPECLILANMAFKVMRSLNHIPFVSTVAAGIYSALVEKAKELDSAHYGVSGCGDRALRLYYDLNLEAIVADAVFRDRCTEEAYSFKTIDEVVGACSSFFTINSVLRLKAFILLFEGGDASFDSLMVLYRNREDSSANNKDVLVKKLAAHVSECQDRDVLWALYLDNHKDISLKKASNAFLKRLLELD